MSSKTLQFLLGLLVVAVLLGGTFTAGLLIGNFLPARAEAASLPEILSFPAPQTADKDPQNGAPKTGIGNDRDQLFKPFWEAWQIIHDQYVDQPVDDTELMRGAIRGMLEALGDDHTTYMDPVQYERANAPLQGEYEGIGAWVDANQEYLTIVSPMPNSPAERAGLKPGDQIVAVDGEDMTGIDGELVRRRVVGPEGTTVTLTIAREGLPETFDVVVERAAIILPMLESEMLENDIAYIQLFTFGDSAAEDMRAALRELLRQNPKGMILDLRNNGGGYLQVAVNIASEFISDGIVLYEEYGDGTLKEYPARRGGRATQIPLVVLINEGSASASEILAGAIQDYERGLLVGTTSFGKGSVQSWVPLEDNGGAVRVTIARWLTPDKRQIHSIGLEPDIEVPLTEEDIQAERDPQLEKAIELLTQGN